MQKTRFLVFVDRVFMFVIPTCIHKFHFISGARFYDPIHLEMWISLIAQTVHELDLDLNGNLFEMQMNHFRFNKLVILKLKGHFINFEIPSQASVCFPNLQTLHLDGIRLAIAIDSSVSFPNLMILHFRYVTNENEESFRKLVSSCPVLQELYLSYLSPLSIWTPCLTSLPLVVLSLSGIDRVDIDFKIPAKVSICFPYLQQLHLSQITFSIPGDSSVCFPNLTILHFGYLNGESVRKLISSCPVLQDLYICFNDWKELPRLIIPSLTKLQLSCLLSRDQAFELQIDDPHKLQFLSLQGPTLKVFWTPFMNNNISSDFCNLKRLELDGDDCSELSLVINNLLECMDNLEHLSIKMNYRFCTCDHRSWPQPSNVPKGLAWHVTKVSFNQSQDDCNYQLEFLRYILKNARVLQELCIRSHYSSEKRNRLMKKVSKFPKESQACQVKFT